MNTSGAEIPAGDPSARLLETVAGTARGPQQSVGEDRPKTGNPTSAACRNRPGVECVGLGGRYPGVEGPHRFSCKHDGSPRPADFHSAEPAALSPMFGAAHAWAWISMVSSLMVGWSKAPHIFLPPLDKQDYGRGDQSGIPHQELGFAARRAAAPVAPLNWWRGMLRMAKRRRSSGSVWKSASMKISTVSSLE